MIAFPALSNITELADIKQIYYEKSLTGGRTPSSELFTLTASNNIFCIVHFPDNKIKPIIVGIKKIPAIYIVFLPGHLFPIYAKN